MKNSGIPNIHYKQTIDGVPIYGIGVIDLDKQVYLVMKTKKEKKEDGENVYLDKFFTTGQPYGNYTRTESQSQAKKRWGYQVYDKIVK